LSRVTAHAHPQGKLKPPEQPDIDVASLFPPETQGAQHAVAPELSAEACAVPPAAGEIDEILELLNRVRSNSQSSADDNALTDSSSVEVGILSGRTFSKLPEAEVGHFYSGESYVVLHAFHDRAKDARQWVVYFWEGKGASKLKWPTFQLGIFPALGTTSIATNTSEASWLVPPNALVRVRVRWCVCVCVCVVQRRRS
jgi:hypothetical protein